MVARRFGPALPLTVKSPARLAPSASSAEVAHKNRVGGRQYNAWGRVSGDACIFARRFFGAGAGLAWHCAEAEQPAASGSAHRGVKRVAHAALPPKIAASATVGVSPVEPAKSEPTSAAASEILPTDRLKIQSALLWSGDYTGSVGGDDPMLAAIRNYQKRARARVTGVRAPIFWPPPNLMKTSSAGPL